MLVKDPKESEDFDQVARCLGVIPPLDKIKDDSSDIDSAEENDVVEDEIHPDFDIKAKRQAHRKNRMEKDRSVHRKESMFLYNIQQDKKKK